MPDLITRKAIPTATYITTQSEAALSGEVVLGTGVIMQGVAGSRPAAGTAGRLYYSTDTGVLERDTGAAWQSLGGTLTASADLGADVSIPTAGTYVDGPSVSLGAGTWLIVGQVTVRCITGTNGNAGGYAKLWDGTTVWATGEQMGTQVDVTNNTIPVHAVVTLGGTTTVKISATVETTGFGAGTIKAALHANGAGNNASHIRAHRVS